MISSAGPNKPIYWLLVIGVLIRHLSYSFQLKGHLLFLFSGHVSKPRSPPVICCSSLDVLQRRSYYLAEHERITLLA